MWHVCHRDIRRISAGDRAHANGIALARSRHVAALHAPGRSMHSATILSEMPKEVCGTTALVGACNAAHKRQLCK